MYQNNLLLYINELIKSLFTHPDLGIPMEILFFIVLIHTFYCEFKSENIETLRIYGSICTYVITLRT